MKGVYVFLADGFEDIEALSVTDVLRRGKIDVKNVSISDSPYITSSHGVTVKADILLNELSLSADGTDSGDFLIFPGGMPGAVNLASCEILMTAMRKHFAAGGSLAAICAAPGTVLSQLDSLKGVMFTCYDGFQGPAKEKGGIFTADPTDVFQSPHGSFIVTGRGAGYALEFALDILAAISGEDNSDSVREKMFLL
ncbi:MAG: DJ-1/PfpI family protein [Alistipes sp.]|nr:DJ-1/PfpI family protein [Candidatus Minthomonas equi]